jgi:16S rRNA (cytosine967-C5)-methyltransferase
MIEENITRLGLSQVECIDSLQGVGKVDRVLVDVPCSNTGVLARRVEARDRFTEESIRSLVQQQRMLLAQGWDFLKPAGVCVYATCSIEAEENQSVVEAFAAERSLQITEMSTTLPAVPLHDGGFHAVLTKTAQG